MMFTKTLPYFFIFLIACQSFASVHVVKVTEEETAADVFLEFVTDNLELADRKDNDYINGNWWNDLERDTQEWSALEANRFLDFLRASRVKQRNILKLFLVTDYLKTLKISIQRPSTIRRGRRSGSHVILDFVDHTINDMDKIDRIMGEEWLDRADNVFKSWTAVNAGRLVNALPFYRIEREGILRIIQATTNYLHALKNDKMNASLGESTDQVRRGTVTELQSVVHPKNEEVATETPKQTPQANEEAATEPSTETPQENEEVATEPPVETPQTNEEIVVEPQTQQTETQVTPQEENAITPDTTGGDVFIQYVRDYFKEEFEQNRTNEQTLDDYVAIQMPPLRSSSSELPGTWQERISHYAQYWTASDARTFLNFLEKNIEVAPMYIVKGLQAVSFFSASYSSFRARFDVYREYLTKDEIRKVIEKKKFALFRNGQPENIRRLIIFLWNYLGEDGFKELLINNTSALSFASTESTINQLEEKKRYLENYLGEGDLLKGEERLKKLLRNGGFTGFQRFKVYFNEETQQWHNTHVDFLENTLNLAQPEIIKLMENNLHAFSIGSLAELEQSYAYLVDYLGEGNEAIGQQLVERIIVIKRNFYGFVNFRVTRNERTGKWENAHVKFLETRLGLEKQKIRELIENNIQAFSGGDLDKTYRFFIDYLAEGDETSANHLLKEIIEFNGNFYGFVNFKIYFDGKTQQWQNTHVKFLETKLGFTKPKIVEIMKNNLQAFSEGTLDQLERSYIYLVDYLGGGDEGHERLKRIIARKGGFAGFVNFRVRTNNGILYNTHVDFLEDKQKLGFERSKVIEFMENNLQAFSESTLAELNQAYTYLVNYLGKGDRIKGRQLLKSIIEERGGLHNFVHFKVNTQDDNTYKNDVVTFLNDTMNFSQEQIIKILIENKLQAFSAVGLDELNQSYTYLVNYLGEGNQAKGKKKLARIIKKKGGLKAFIGFRLFANTDGSLKNEMISFLEQGMEYDQETIIKLMETSFSTLFGSEFTESNFKDFIDKVHTAIHRCQIALSL